LTPLHDAASLGKTPIVQVLLDCGASPERQDHAGLTPLDRAQSLGPDHPIVQLLRKWREPKQS
jgi:ankyrin repeat protein